jgi:hypothetical protein
MNRAKFAEIVRKATPQVATLGPPLPEVMDVRWPKIVSDKLLRFELDTATDIQIKNHLINKIRGR